MRVKARGSGSTRTSRERIYKNMEVSHMVCMGILIMASVIDIRQRNIPVGMLAAADTGALVYQAVFQKEDVILVAGGAAAGIVMLAVSRLTKEGIGYGDSLGILGLGIYLGLWGLLEVLAGAFFLLALGAAFVLAKKRMSRKSMLPFYPFLAVSYLLCQIGGVYGY